MSKPLRLLYAAGPGNIIGTYSHWVNGRDDPSQVAITYSSQFYEVCRALDAQGYAISSFGEKKLLRDGQFRIEHRPNPFRTASGLLYHLGQLRYGLGLIVSAVCFRADVAIIADGTTHWFVLSLLERLGVRAIPSLHCALWCKYTSPRTLEKWILKLNRYFFATGCSAILAASEDIAEQVEALTGGDLQPILKFLPAYRRTEFADVAEPDEKRSPFRVFFAGRIELDKGVFDLLKIAGGLADAGRHDIKFDLCGEGSALEPLRLAATQANLDSSFACHGYCNKPKMRQMFQQAHAVIVPTRTEFVEGFNQVIAESVLSGRPVVTSAVCPALSCVRDAVVEVPPNDIKGYTDALLDLCDDRDFYEEKRRGCLGVQEQFYDFSRSWGAALKSVLVGMHQAGELGGTLGGNS
ncbi:glycosyltransferase family 4 protein [Kamptonema formosum]|uniref:glycosyltransferase family 4 protein n=1 Tax=Kamptonema formosum TaxID=331992 RepID=UPI0003752312|nr:glycosyltransferase family 4 protein [Oscillatoria sp. PCC 10802]